MRYRLSRPNQLVDNVSLEYRTLFNASTWIIRITPNHTNLLFDTVRTAVNMSQHRFINHDSTNRTVNRTHDKSARYSARSFNRAKDSTTRSFRTIETRLGLCRDEAEM